MIPNAVHGSGMPREMYILPQILLLTVYLPGTQNVNADALSRNFITDYEWGLHYMVVADIFGCWGTLIRDLFASHVNTKCR